MKIGYFADGHWAHMALKKIVDDLRLQIVFIVPRYDTQDPILSEWAEKLGVDYLPISNVNSSDAIKKLKEYGADLFVSMSFNQILRKQILAVAPLGFINCHAGALPFYRGRNILNWVLINDEKEFGVTVHYIDEGIDTGDIIVRRMSPISDEDNYATLLDRATEICGEVLYEALELILEGKVKRIRQIDVHSVGFYCGRRRDGDEIIDWNWSSRRIFNFVRAITTPGPCAITRCNNHSVLVKSATMVEGALSYIGTTGEVVDISNGNFVVKTGDSVILIIDAEFDQKLKVYIGSRFN